MQEVFTNAQDHKKFFLFGFLKQSPIMSYCPSKKGVSLLRAKHSTKEVTKNEETKLLIIMDYNKIWSGIDTMDKLVRTQLRKLVENSKGFSSVILLTFVY